jgi:hypothetical protein
MSESRIEITRDELFTDAVEQALARERAHRPTLPPEQAVPPLRRLLMNSLFYLPFAAALGALASWIILEPRVDDFPLVRGEVVLVNSSPFDLRSGITTITVGSKEIALFPATELLPGAQGQPAFASLEDIKVGTAVEAVGLGEGENRIMADAIRPSDEAPTAVKHGSLAIALFFPLTGALIALALLLAEGITTRNWGRMIVRSLLGSLLAAIFSLLAMVVAGPALLLWPVILKDAAEHTEKVVATVADLSTISFLAFAAVRSVAWAALGAGMGLGMNLVRSTRAQLRNSVLGGALGGALGGLFFDPIDRFFKSSPFDGGEVSRLVGVVAVGLAVGLFVALVERLAREAWLKVLTGPLAGKSFVLYRTPTRLGSAPAADIYLYKDAEIDPQHALIHRAGNVYEIEDAGSRTGTKLAGQPVRRRRLVSGDQIVLGGTVLVFEERAKRRTSWSKLPAR